MICVSDVAVLKMADFFSQYAATKPANQKCLFSEISSLVVPLQSNAYAFNKPQVTNMLVKLSKALKKLNSLTKEPATLRIQTQLLANVKELVRSFRSGKGTISDLDNYLTNFVIRQFQISL